MSRSAEMYPEELHLFVNALRECLGLAPLYDRLKIEGASNPGMVDSHSREHDGRVGAERFRERIW